MKDKPTTSSQLELCLQSAGRPPSCIGRLVQAMRARMSSQAATVLVFWGILNAFAAIGVVAVLFVLLANGTFTSVMVEAGNLASHYSSAPPASQARFRSLVWFCVAAAFVALSAARWRTLRAAQKSLPPALQGPSARS